MESSSLSSVCIQKRSKVWPYFIKLPSGKVKCNLCLIELSYARGSTGTMMNHLRFRHKSVSMNEDHAKLQSGLKKERNTAFSSRLNSKDRWERCTSKLAAMCAMDLRPLSICEGYGFRKFCQELNSGYKVPCKATVENYLTLLYDEEKEKMSEHLKKHIVGVAFTTDLWTNLATEAYLTLTCHFLDSDWKLNNFVLSTKEIEEHHSGENIAAEIQSIATEYGFEPSMITALVTNNASNMTTCAEHLGWLNVRCFGHTLQLSISSAFDKIESISHAIGSAKRLVTFFTKSILASEKLHERQKQMKLPQHSLTIDCATHWNSTFDMLERLLEQRLAVYAVLHDSKVTKLSQAKTVDISDADWNIIEAIVPILYPLHTATRVMCSEHYPSLSGVMPILFSLINHHLKPRENESVCFIEFKELITQDLENSFKIGTDEMCTNIRMMSTFLDPRYKSLPFLTNDQKSIVYNGVITSCATLAGSNSTGTDNDENASSQPSASIQQENKKRKLNQDDMSFLLGNYFEDRSVIVPSTPQAELELYLEQRQIPTSSSPFEWWKNNSTNFPTMSRLARMVLCIPGTSVPSEHVFSTAGGTVAKLRAALDPDTVHKLIFINKCLKHPTDTTEQLPCVNKDVVNEPASSSTSVKSSVQVKQEPTDPAVTGADEQLQTVPPL